MKRLRIGTRKSQLALWQAKQVQQLLSDGGWQTDLVPIETTGDKIQNQAISKIGSKGVFTLEIEQGLRAGQIDLAVHSAKDMPSEIPEEYELIAFTQREKPNDVILSSVPGFQLNQPGTRIGTSSTRRVAFLRHYYPNTQSVDVRGNLQTRVSKMEEGHCDALLLAFAGAHRMNYDHLISKTLSHQEFIPPAGQGSIVVEVSANLPAELKDAIRELVNHRPSEECIQTERSFLMAMHGGCSVPIFSYAFQEGDQIRMEAGIISLDGSELISETGTTRDDGVGLGRSIAARVLEKGGNHILMDIKRQLGS